MISRRDKLLVRPWEQRRYENHRRKVQSALPAIDVGPPANRVHVFCKLKKQQKESERCDKIEKDNLKLIQKMRNLMSTTRIDNTWTTAQPNFLNRVTIYSPNDRKHIYKSETPSLIEDNTRKGRCHACTPKKLEPPKIPEERVPWAPPKAQVGRARSNSLPLRKIQITSPPKDETSRKSSPKAPKTPEIPQKPRSKSSRTRSRKIGNDTSSQSIILTRGDLHLAVNFPPDTLVKLRDGQKEKFIISGPCQCKAIRSVK